MKKVLGGLAGIIVLTAALVGWWPKSSLNLAGAGSDGTAPAPAAGNSPTSTLTIPERTWVSRPLGTGYGGPGLRPYASKHTRLLYASKRGRMVLTGGDYANPHISDDGNQMVWALDLGSGPAPTWRLIGPWCNGPEQPGRPDTVLWAYDSKRDRGIVMPGFYFITEGGTSECPGVKDLPDPMFFDFATNKWQRVPFGPPLGGYGGDEGASFGVYDPVTDSVYRVRSTDDGNVMEILSLQTNRWSNGSMGLPASGNREQAVIDVEWRSIYLINRYLKALVRYSIRRGSVDVIPLPRQARPPQDLDLETYLAFDPINRVVLYPNSYENSGRMYGLGIYHVDSKKWEWEAVPIHRERARRQGGTCADPGRAFGPTSRDADGIRSFARATVMVADCEFEGVWAASRSRSRTTASTASWCGAPSSGTRVRPGAPPLRLIPQW